jgi:predicted RNase H-like HicB family nuclease
MADRELGRPHQTGGIATQGKDLAELKKNLREAVEYHFAGGQRPRQIRLRFVNDAVLA